MFSKQDRILAAVFGCLVFFFFAQIFLTAKTFFIGDIMYQFQPWWSFNAQGIQAGSLYLWNPYLSNGEPFISNPQIAFFSPATIFFYFFDFCLAFKLFIFFNSFLAGLFVYLLAKKVRQNSGGALLASIVFSLGGFFLVMVEFFSLLGSLAWVSLIFLFLRETFLRKKFSWLILTALAFSLQFFAGYPQITAYTGLAAFLYAVFFQKKPVRFAGYLIVVVVFSLLLSAVQFLPSLEWLTKLFKRGTFDFAVLSDWYLPPYFLIKFILPGLWGKANLPFFLAAPFSIEHWSFKQSWLNTFYLGIAPLIFVYFSLAIKKTGKNIFWLVLIGFSLICALAQNPWYYLFLKNIPIFRFFVHPALFMYLVVVSLSCLAGQGFTEFFRTKSEDKKKLIRWLFFCLPVFVVGYYLSLIIWGSRLNDFQLSWVNKNFLIFMLVFLVNLYFFWLNYLGRFSSRLTKLLIFVVLVGELYVFGRDLNPAIRGDFFHLRPANLTPLKAHLADQRIFFEPESQMNRLMTGETIEEEYQSLRDVLQPNSGLPYRVNYVYSYQSLFYRPYKEYMYFLREQGFFGNRLLDLLGAKYVFSYQPLTEVKLQVVGNSKIYAYENKTVLPSAFYVPRAKFIKDRPEQLIYLAGKKFSPEQEIIIGEEFTARRPEPVVNKTLESPILVFKNHPNKRGYLAKISQAGWIFFSNTAYPGWEAYIDGKRSKIFTANYSFQAVEAVAGAHRIDFIYRSRFFLLGLMISALSFAAVFLLMLSKLRKVTFFVASDRFFKKF